MEIAIRARAQKEEWADRNDDCEVAIVDVTQALISRLTPMVDAARAAQAISHDLWEVYFWGGYEPEYYPYSAVLALEEAGLSLDDGIEYGELPENVELGEESRTECNQYVVRWSNGNPEILWFCYPKNGNAGIVTEAIPFAELLEFADRKAL